MKVHLFSAILLLFSVFSLFAAKKPDAKSVKLQELSTVNTVESSVDFLSIEKGKAFVRMFHNEGNVKVQIVVTDESMQTKFLMQGLNVYLDISGKKKKKYSVQFPRLEREQMRGNMQQPRGEANRQERMAVDISQLTLMASANNAVLVQNKNKTALNVENAAIQPLEGNKLLFTVCLPLSLLGDKIGKNNIISVGLLSEMETPSSGMSPSGGGGGMPPGGGSRGGGGMGRPGSGGPRSGGGARPTGVGSAFSEMNTPFNTWVTFGVE
jgi:hypothetical protein